MKKVFLMMGLTIGSWASAQSYVNQVLILNEGYYDYTNSVIVEPVTIGSYNPATHVYQVVDTLNGMRFGSDLVIDGDFYYVAADTKIYKINLNTHAIVATVDCPGVRNLAVYQNKLVATRGEYMTTYDSYLHVYAISDLHLTQAFDTINGPKWASQNIVMDGAMAYVAVNNGYEWGNEKGIVGKLDLNAMTYGNEIDLGVDGKNPDNLVKSGNYILAVNNKDWSGASVSKIALADNAVSTVNLSTASTGCGTSALRDDKLIYQVSQETVLHQFDYAAMNNVGPIAGIDLNFYELSHDAINDLLYASNTDFFSYGKIYVYDNANAEVTHFNTGTSPGTIVFDVRSQAGVSENAITFSVSPNPTADFINVHSSLEGTVKVLDQTGKEVAYSAAKTINVSGLSNGTYFISFNGKCEKFIKL